MHVTSNSMFVVSVLPALCLSAQVHACKASSKVVINFSSLTIVLLSCYRVHFTLAVAMQDLCSDWLSGSLYNLKVTNLLL